MNGTQSFCGGNSDFELSPAITADGQLLTQVLALTGGVIDLGPRPITGVMAVPEAGYQIRTVLQSGHLYAVESNRKYALLYVANIQSNIDPRLAQLAGDGGSEPQTSSGELAELFEPDLLERMLDQSLITVDFQWVYLENGSRHFQYGFAAGGGRVPRPYVFRQPRVPSTALKQ